jgi:hypothetical protein
MQQVSQKPAGVRLGVAGQFLRGPGLEILHSGKFVLSCLCLRWPRLPQNLGLVFDSPKIVFFMSHCHIKLFF